MQNQNADGASKREAPYFITEDTLLHPTDLRKLLDAVAQRTIDVESAMRRLATLPYEDLGFARVDHHRALRCGFAEVIFGQGKTPKQVLAIFEALARRGQPVLATRVAPEAAALVRRRFRAAEYHDVARTLTLRRPPTVRSKRGAASTRGHSSTTDSEPGGDAADFVAIVCAGTSDLPVAEEARITAEMMGARSRTFYDVGVAGIHRLLAESQSLRQAAALVVVAGMEGALPSVVAGLVDAPVIAVPTSVGYGASLGGVAALLAMLNSCASGLSVVNIDNGFGAAYQAAMIARRHAGP